ncbi:NAD-dependent deacylase [Fontimonas sp. SYSU GA230001]|uniref:SIR2 family NAD-dependent protein deacylase n=1 Tax=Fontimonas sp. SYSU GA230001 TaxID=3142450 RepID=UPI0032B5E321
MLELSRFTRVVVFTGAGMSAESGVPTYRGRGGIWQQYDYREYACEDAFQRDPGKVLDFHELRRTHVLGCAPHAGHAHLAALQRGHPALSLITQNIDGLHQRAGSAVAAELHGSLWRLRCARHGVREDAAAGRFETRRCPQCGSMLRPDITWFGDLVDEAVFGRARALIDACDLFVSIGTSAVVWPAAGLIPFAHRPRPYLVEINPEETEGSERFDAVIRAPASALAQWVA